LTPKFNDTWAFAGEAAKQASPMATVTIARYFSVRMVSPHPLETDTAEKVVLKTCFVLTILVRSGKPFTHSEEYPPWAK
jgi:hypothetical protein